MNKSLLIGLLLSGLSAFAFFGCSSMKIDTRQDPQVKLINYKTYAWAPTEPEGTSDALPGRKELLEKTLQQSVDEQLSAKGYKQTTPEDADFLVHYSASTQDKITFRTAPPSAARAGIDYGPSYAESYRQGQLTLDFIDPKKKSVIWEGIATDALGDSGASQDQIAEAVQKLVKDYPHA